MTTQLGDGRELRLRLAAHHEAKARALYVYRRGKRWKRTVFACQTHALIVLPALSLAMSGGRHQHPHWLRRDFKGPLIRMPCLIQSYLRVDTRRSIAEDG